MGIEAICGNDTRTIPIESCAVAVKEARRLADATPRVPLP
jgi:hypothetical protein